jgi:hypothetical protein
MKTPAPAISKDLVTKLRQLAAGALADETNYEKAKSSYQKAAGRAATSTSEFALALYEFALKFAPFAGVVDAKLAEMNLKYASSSIYYRIARLAFDGTNEAVRVSVGRYGKLIEEAAAQNYSADDFRREAEKGIDAFKKKLGIIAQPKLDLIDLGRKKASQLLQNKTYPIQGLAADLNLNDGEEVGLIAKIENGELVVYGLVPAQVGSTNSALRKLGAPEVASQSDRLALWKDMLRALKLITSAADEKAPARYAMTNDTVSLSVTGTGAHAVLTSPAERDFLNGKSITLSVADWARICSTFIPMARLIESLTFDGKQLIVRVDDNDTPDLGGWFEESGNVSRIGTLVDASLTIDVNTLKSGVILYEGAKWRDATVADEGTLSGLQAYVPTKPLVTFSLPKLSSLKSVSVPTSGNVNLNKAQLRTVKKAVKKLLGIAPQVTIDHAQNLLRMTAVAKGSVSYSVIVETA